MASEGQANVRERVIVALDLPTVEANERLVDQLGDAVVWYKVGLSLFIQRGPDVVRRLRGAGKRVFLDLKLHDIPSTVGRAVSMGCQLGAELMTVHSAAGAEAMKAAARASQEFGEGRAKILAVTVLTSDGGREGVVEQVVKLAQHAASQGCDGVICSPVEAAPVRQAVGTRFLIVTPGVRWGQGVDDQARVGTPREAVGAGADYLVIGRPLYGAEDLRAAVASLEANLSGRG